VGVNIGKNKLTEAARLLRNHSSVKAPTRPGLTGPACAITLPL
jgi:hypothetical protein